MKHNIYKINPQEFYIFSGISLIYLNAIIFEQPLID
jgi:hypothetical protein